MQLIHYVKNSINMKDNTDKLLEAIEHPEQFSNEELNLLLSDPATRQLYDLISKTVDTLTPAPNTDIDMEWNRFASEHQISQRLKIKIRFPRHVAAAVIAIIASLAVVAATIGIRSSINKRELAKTTVADQLSVIPQPIANSSETDTIIDSLQAPATIVFKDETFEEIINIIADYYGTSIFFSTRNAKALRMYFKWNQEQTLEEIIEQLNNFEQINIVIKENTLIIE